MHRLKKYIKLFLLLFALIIMVVGTLIFNISSNSIGLYTKISQKVIVTDFLNNICRVETDVSIVNLAGWPVKCVRIISSHKYHCNSIYIMNTYKGDQMIEAVRYQKKIDKVLQDGNSRRYL